MEYATSVLGRFGSSPEAWSDLYEDDSPLTEPTRRSSAHRANISMTYRGARRTLPLFFPFGMGEDGVSVGRRISVVSRKATFQALEMLHLENTWMHYAFVQAALEDMAGSDPDYALFHEEVRRTRKWRRNDRAVVAAYEMVREAFMTGVPISGKRRQGVVLPLIKF